MAGKKTAATRTTPAVEPAVRFREEWLSGRTMLPGPEAISETRAGPV